MSDPARRHPLARLLAFPPGAPAPLLALVALSCSLVGVFVVPLLLPGAPGWLRLVVGVLVVLGLMVLTAALLRRAHARGRSRR